MIFSKTIVFNQKNKEYYPFYSVLLNYVIVLTVFEDKIKKLRERCSFLDFQFRRNFLLETEKL